MDLVGSLDAAYIQNGAFLMSAGTYVALMKTKAATSGDYLVEAETDSEGYPLLFGKRVYLSPSMPAIATTAKCVAFGALDRFIRREVQNSLAAKVYTEKYATSGGIGYESFWRIDGLLAKATHAPVPVKYLQNS